MKKLSVLSNLFIAIAFNFVMSGLFSAVTGLDHLACFAVWMLVSLRFAKMPNARNLPYLRDGLNKEVWLSELIEQFWPNWSFMNEADDMSEWVENDAINLAEAGVEPNVLINNAVFPVPFAGRTDTPHRLVLNTYDTEGTVIRNAELVELSYNKRQSVINQHKSALANMIGLHAAHSYAPAEHGSSTPVLDKTGDTKFKIENLIEMQQYFNDMNVPAEKRIAVLTTKHLADIQTQNLNLFNQIKSEPGAEVYGWKIYWFSKNPYYTIASKEKLAFGATPDAEDDKMASIFFYGRSVMKALGTADMFEQLKSPTEKGDIINFQQRALVLPKNNKYLGAIIQ